jgi:hypothetical protein
MEINLDAKFTVAVQTARGAYEDLDDAKAKAQALAILNPDVDVTIENEKGKPIFTFKYCMNKILMTEISYAPVWVDCDDA